MIGCSVSFAPEKRPRSTGRCNPAPGIGYSITRVHIIPGSARDGKPRSFLLCFAAAGYLSKEIRDSDILVRYASDEFVAVSPRMSRESAENLKSRLQNHLDPFRFA